MNAILLIDFGSTYTKVTAVDPDNEKVLGNGRAFTTVQTDIGEGLSHAVSDLEERIGKHSFSETYACSSAAGGLKMVAVGLVPDLTMEAAKKAALNAGAKVLKGYSYELTQAERDEIAALRPDMILLSGGTDGGNKKILLHNAEVLASIELPFPVIVAGNCKAASEAERILKEGGKTCRVCENVMPEFNRLNIEPAKEMVRTVFLERIVKAKGLTKISELLQGIVMPTPAAVLMAATLLGSGVGSEAGMGELLLVDVGGATTDVYSIASGNPTRSSVVLKGLPEPFAKRTVEGDLGVRYSATFLAEEAGIDNIVAFCGESFLNASKYLQEIADEPGLLPQTHREKTLDFSLAYHAVKIAFERHVGKIETHFTTNGPIVIQTGKDLSRVKTVIGTGGPIINSSNPKGILNSMKAAGDAEQFLKPMDYEVFLDNDYIFAAMGLLSTKYPEVALRILKSHLMQLS